MKLSFANTIDIKRDAANLHVDKLLQNILFFILQYVWGMAVILTLNLDKRIGIVAVYLHYIDCFP